MTNNKKLGITIWFLSLALSCVLFFFLARSFNTSYWIAFGFVVFSFLSSIIFQLIVFNKISSTTQSVITNGSILVTYFYMLAQIPISIVFALWAENIPTRIAILVNFVLLIIFWILILSGLVGNEHITKVESRQKDNHIEL